MRDPQPIIVDRSAGGDHEEEAELAVARMLDGDRLELALDDGQAIILPAGDLRNVLGLVA